MIEQQATPDLEAIINGLKLYNSQLPRNKDDFEFGGIPAWHWIEQAIAVLTNAAKPVGGE